MEFDAKRLGHQVNNLIPFCQKRPFPKNAGSILGVDSLNGLNLYKTKSSS